jgi:hypothetical protein
MQGMYPCQFLTKLIYLRKPKFVAMGNKLAAKAAPQVTALPTLADLASQASSAVDTLTFNISNVEVKMSSTGNCGFRATCDDGTVVTFWSSNMDQVVEMIDDNGNYRVLPGTRVAEDGGLIDKDARQGGFWK